MPASLTLGGVDLNRFVSNDVSFEMASGFKPVVSVNGITVSSDPLSTSITKPNWTQEPLSLLGSSQAELFTIDSSTPFLWLPEKVCDAFALAFNLTYNDTLQLYLYSNFTGPSVLTDWNMTFTFALADLPGASKTVDINFPYDAFNQQLSFPFPALNATFSSPAVNYFPLRKASNNTQYTIGRMFLQEAYLAVDYERNNFSISQAKFANDAVSNVKLAEITRPANSTFAGPPENSNVGLSVGVKVGIGIGIAILTIAAIGLVFFFCFWKKRRVQKGALGAPTERKGFFKRKSNGNVKGPAAEATELLGDKRQPQEVSADKSSTRFELPGDAPVEMLAEVPSSFYVFDKARYGNTPAELEHRSSSAKNSLPPHMNRSSQSPSLPPYSAAQTGRRSGSNVSPSSTVLNGGGLGPGTVSSGISGISPDNGSPNFLSRKGSYGLGKGASIAQPVGFPQPSPLMPPTPLDKPASRSSLSLPRSTGDEHAIPKRSVSRSSRFREEGMVTETQRPQPLPPPPPQQRFSWQDTI